MTGKSLALSVRLLAANGLQRLKKLGVRDRIGYIGGQGDGNLGDEAMYEAAQRLAGHHSLVPFRGSRHEKLLSRFRLSGPRFFSSVILGGGTLINPGWLNEAAEAVRQRVPIWSLGTGVGSCGFGQSETVDINAWYPVLREFDQIGVRGPLSQKRLQEIGIEKADVVGDLALALTTGTFAGTRKAGSFALNVAAQGPAVHNQAWRDGVINAVRHLTRLGWSVVPLAMHKTDANIVREVLCEAGVKQGSVFVCLTPDAFFEQVAPCSFTLAVRLHAAVLSCCVGVAPVLIGYRDKCSDFMESMGLGEWMLPPSEVVPGQFLSTIREMESKWERLGMRVMAVAGDYKSRLQNYVSERLAT